MFPIECGILAIFDYPEILDVKQELWVHHIIFSISF